MSAFGLPPRAVGAVGTLVDGLVRLPQSDIERSPWLPGRLRIAWTIENAVRGEPNTVLVNEVAS